MLKNQCLWFCGYEFVNFSVQFFAWSLFQRDLKGFDRSKNSLHHAWIIKKNAQKCFFERIHLCRPKRRAARVRYLVILDTVKCVSLKLDKAKKREKCWCQGRIYFELSVKINPLFFDFFPRDGNQSPVFSSSNNFLSSHYNLIVLIAKQNCDTCVRRLVQLHEQKRPGIRRYKNLYMLVSRVQRRSW